MSAKQTATSASLVVLLVASAGSAHAEPEPEGDASQPPGEVQPEPSNEEPAHIVIEPEVTAEPVIDRPPPTNEIKTKTMPLIPKREPTGTFQIGAGFSSDENFIATARLEQTRLFGSDKGLLMSALISRRRQEFLTRYTDPTLLGTNFKLQGDLYARTIAHPGFTREAAGGALTLSRTIAPHLTGFVTYSLENVKVSTDEKFLFRGTTPSEPLWTGGNIAALRAGFVYDDTVGDLFYPRRGTRFGASLFHADRDLGGDINFDRADTWLAHHRPLGPFTLHLSGRASAVSDGTPMSERLHFDGSSDIRGYAPGEIGPKDPLTGMPVGGNMMWTARGELEAPLVPSIGLSAVGFVDAGGLYGKLDGQNAASYGFGLVWRSPIGPLRFDWAYPMDGDGKPRFIFGIGGMF